jgi:hypothetical protein
MKKSFPLKHCKSANDNNSHQQVTFLNPQTLICYIPTQRRKCINTRSCTATSNYYQFLKCYMSMLKFFLLFLAVAATCAFPSDEVCHEPTTTKPPCTTTPSCTTTPPSLFCPVIPVRTCQASPQSKVSISMMQFVYRP